MLELSLFLSHKGYSKAAGQRQKREISPEREGLLIKFLKSDPVSGGLMLNPRNSEGFLNQPRLLVTSGKGHTGQHRTR